MFRQSLKEETCPASPVCWRTRFLFRHVSLLVWVFIPLLALASEAGAEGPPLQVRFSGKLYFVPTGDPGRHGDLLAFGISKEDEVYFQVDEFHTTSKAQSEFSVLRDMRRHKPNLRIINGEILAPLLTEEHIRKPVLLAGFFYPMSGQLALVLAVLEEEEEEATSGQDHKPKAYSW